MLSASNITPKPQYFPPFPVSAAAGQASPLADSPLDSWTDSPPHHSRVSQQGGVRIRVAQRWMRPAVQPL